jgi:hypothetical protein
VAALSGGPAGRVAPRGVAAAAVPARRSGSRHAVVRWSDGPEWCPPAKAACRHAFRSLLRRTRTKRPRARNRPPPRSRIRGKRQSRAGCRVPCGWAARGVGSRADNALLRSPGSANRARPGEAPHLCAAGRFGGRRTAPAEEQSRDSAQPEEGSCPSCCSMPPAAVAHPPRCRSSTPAGHRATRECANPADPPTIEEIIAVMRHAGDRVHGHRLRGLIVVLWRAGLRIHEALALAEADLDARRGSLLVRRGKGGRRREVGMDDWAWEQLAPWLAARVELPVGPLFCVVNGATRGRPWAAAAARMHPGTAAVMPHTRGALLLSPVEAKGRRVQASDARSGRGGAVRRDRRTATDPGPDKQKHAALVRACPSVPVAGHAPRRGAKTVPRDGVTYPIRLRARAQNRRVATRRTPVRVHTRAHTQKGDERWIARPSCAASATRCGALRSAADGSDGTRTRDLRRDSARLIAANTLQIEHSSNRSTPRSSPFYASQQAASGRRGPQARIAQRQRQLRKEARAAIVADRADGRRRGAWRSLRGAADERGELVERGLAVFAGGVRVHARGRVREFAAARAQAVAHPGGDLDRRDPAGQQP